MFTVTEVYGVVQRCKCRKIVQCMKKQTDKQQTKPHNKLMTFLTLIVMYCVLDLPKAYLQSFQQLLDNRYIFLTFFYVLRIQIKQTLSACVLQLMCSVQLCPKG